MNKKILIAGISIIFLLLLIPSASATWCDNDFGKKAPIHINNSGGSAQTYYQVELNITYDSDMNTDFSDIRVYNESDCSLIPLWNESAVASTWNKIWFNASHVSASSWCNDTYYLYYDYSSASSVSNITTSFPFGDEFLGTILDSSDSFSIESTKAIGNYSCHGIPSISNQSNGEFWTGWHYSYHGDWDGNSAENITKMVLYANNNTNSSLSYIMDYDGFDHEHVSQIEKLGNTYYAFFINGTGGVNTQPWVINFKNSSDGNTWNGPYSLGTNSTQRSSPKLMKINDTIWWIVYPNKNATAYSIRYIEFNVTSGVFGSETDIVTSSTANMLYQPFGLYDSSTDKYFIYYWQDLATDTIKVVNRTGSGVWSSPQDIIAVNNVYGSPWVIDWNNKFFLFYYDSNYDIKVMDGTDGVSFSAFQTLHSNASNYYWYPAVAPINSTHLAMVYAWHKPSAPKNSIIYWDILKWEEGTGGKWKEKNSPTVSVENDICSIYYAGTTDWAGIIGLQSFGPYNYAFRQRIKFDSETGVMAGGADAWQDSGTLYDAFFNLEYSNGMYIRSRNNNNQEQTVGTSERTNYHIDEMRWKSGEVKFYRDSALTATHTTQVPNSSLYPFVGTFKSSGSGYAYVDWFIVRKYSSPEPTAQLGAEESHPGYIPPNPTNLQNTTGNFWVNYTWDADSGNVTNGYNVTWNSSWYNTSNEYMNKSVGASNWANITVWAWNSSGSGTISAGSISDQIKTSAADTTFTVTLPVGYTYAHFDLTGIAGGRAHDTSGNANDGTIYGTTQTDGKYGDALKFDGISDYINCNNDLSLDIADAITIEAWVKPDVITGVHEIARKNNAYILRIKNSVYEGIIRSDSTWYYTKSNENPSTALYQHIVTVYNSSDAIKKIKLFVDGVELTYSQQDTVAGSINIDSTDLNLGSALPNTHPFNGAIDKVRIYNQALNLTEIQNNYNNSVTRTGLVGEWTFDHGPSTQTNVTPSGQTSTTPFYNVTNTGNVNLDVKMQLNTTITNVVLKADTDNNTTGAKEVNTSLVTIYSSLTQSNSIDIWMWSDFNHTVEQTTNKTLSINVSQ